MSAYVVTEIDWHDQAKAKAYRDKFSPVLEKFGGKTVAVGPPEVLEGNWKPPRVVVLEFPTKAAVHAWYASPEYAPILKLRLEGAKTNLIVVESAPG